jgi:hypothetical protein
MTLTHNRNTERHSEVIPDYSDTSDVSSTSDTYNYSTEQKKAKKVIGYRMTENSLMCYTNHVNNIIGLKINLTSVI